MRKALVVAALVVSAVVGMVYADADGYDLRGAHADFGPAWVNGLVMFLLVAVPLCGLVLGVFDDLARRRRSR